MDASMHSGQFDVILRHFESNGINNERSSQAAKQLASVASTMAKLERP